MKSLILLSERTYFILLAFIILIPFLLQSKLLLTGKITYATAMYDDSFSSGAGTLRGSTNFTWLEYKADGYTVKFAGPWNLLYRNNERVLIIYTPGNLLNCKVFSFYHIYMHRQAIPMFVLLLFWMAAYTTFPKKVVPKKISIRNLDA